jgi:hypothetical protein
MRQGGGGLHGSPPLPPAQHHFGATRGCFILPEGREADARTRTGDPFITSEVLYQLSYVGAAGSL